LGSLFLLIYFIDVPKITDNDAKVVLFADDTSIIATTSFQEGVQTKNQNTISYNLTVESQFPIAQI
jgi:hypothetical protein